MNILSQEKQQQIAALLNAGNSVRITAARANVHKNTVLRYAKSLSVHKRRSKNPVEAELRNKLIKLKRLLKALTNVLKEI